MVGLVALMEKIWLFTDNFLGLSLAPPNSPIGFSIGTVILMGWIMYFIGLMIAHLASPGGS